MFVSATSADSHFRSYRRTSYRRSSSYRRFVLRAQPLKIEQNSDKDLRKLCKTDCNQRCYAQRSPLCQTTPEPTAAKTAACRNHTKRSCSEVCADVEDGGKWCWKNLKPYAARWRHQCRRICVHVCSRALSEACRGIKRCIVTVDAKCKGAEVCGSVTKRSCVSATTFGTRGVYTSNFEFSGEHKQISFEAFEKGGKRAMC